MKVFVGVSPFGTIIFEWGPPFKAVAASRDHTFIFNGYGCLLLFCPVVVPWGDFRGS